MANVPAVLPEQFYGLTTGPRRQRPRSASILPLGLGRQAISRPPQVVGGRLHPLGVLARCVPQVAPLAPADPLLLTQPVAVRRRLIPCHTIDRTILSHGDSRIVLMILTEPEELLHGHFLGSNGIAPVDLMLATILPPAQP